MSHQALFHQPPHVQVYQDGDDEDDNIDDGYGDSDGDGDDNSDEYDDARDHGSKLSLFHQAPDVQV